NCFGYIHDLTLNSTKQTNRPSPAQLLQYKWILKYKKDKPLDTIKWIHEVYLPKKRELRKLKNLEKQKYAPKEKKHYHHKSYKDDGSHKDSILKKKDKRK